jgi:TPR repeat protein
MRISDHIILPVVLLGLGLTTAHALDQKSPANAVPEIPGVNPVVRPPAPVDGDPTSLASFFQKMQTGDIEGAIKELEHAFRNGNISAGWKLGRMYADGDGVPQDRKRAVEYFRKIIDIPPEEVRGASARFVAYAWVAMGLYYQTGIPNTDIKPDPVRAYQHFTYAAVNFADADAQFHLARTYLDGQGVAKDTKQAAKWMYQAAMKDQYEAQAKFGSMLFLGQGMPRDAATGLMWLEIAKYTAPKGAPGILELYNSAWKQATEEERAAALVHFEQWKRGRSTRSPGHGGE